MQGQVHRAVEGILETADSSGPDAVEEWEVDELLDWTTSLNFDSYFQFWKAVGTSGQEKWTEFRPTNRFTLKDLACGLNGSTHWVGCKNAFFLVQLLEKKYFSHLPKKPYFLKEKVLEQG